MVMCDSRPTDRQALFGISLPGMDAKDLFQTETSYIVQNQMYSRKT